MNEFSGTAEVQNRIVTIAAPASKSLSHRYLIGAALAHGASVIKNILDSADTEATRGILCEAGARMIPITGSGDASAEIVGWKVFGMKGKPRGGTEVPLQCYIGESGTTCRLLTAVLAAGDGLFRICGCGRMHERPIGELGFSLEKLGCKIEYEEKRGYPPYIINANGLNPKLCDGYLQIGIEDSSQYLSGLLLAAPLASTPICIEISGKKTVSWPYVGLTLQCLSDFGIQFRVEKRARLAEPWVIMQGATWKKLKEAKPGCLRIRIWPGNYISGEFIVEGDWSQASYFLAAGALGKKPVKMTGLNLESLQGDRTIIDILRKMGAKIEMSDNEITVYPSILHGVSLDMGDCPDLVPTVAVLATYAKGSTRIGNVAHLRLKESDRILAPIAELSKTGVTIDALSDGMLINGMGGLKGHVRNRPDCPQLPADIALASHNDHRIAMSLALLEMNDCSLSVKDRLDDPEVVKKSCPQFWQLWSALK